MTRKLLQHMILDLETVRLVSLDDLMQEAGMSEHEAKSVWLADEGIARVKASM